MISYCVLRTVAAEAAAPAADPWIHGSMDPYFLPVQAATGGRLGVSVYKAGRSVPLDSAQLDLSRLVLSQLGSAGVGKCFEIHVPSSGLKTQKNRKRPENAFHE